MRRLFLAILAVLTFAAVSSAQTSGGAQAAASSNTQAAGAVGQNGVQAQAAASAKVSASQQGQGEKHRDEGTSAPASNGVSVTGSASGTASAGSSAGTTTSGLQLQDSTDVHAVLTNSVDSRKCKPGDPVSAKVTEDVKENGQVVVHKGTHLMGHVTQAEAKGKGQSESSLGIAFDHARMKNGQEVPLQLGVQALAAAQTASTAAVDNDAFASAGARGAASGGARAGSGVLGGTGSTVAGTAGAATGTAAGVGRTVGSVGSTAGAATSATGSVAGQAGGLNAAGQLMSSSSGVFGLQGLSLTSNLSNATQGSVVTSTGKSVQLSSGTQMLLHVAK